MSKLKKPALGKGLSALLKNAETDITSTKSTIDNHVAESIAKILIKNIETNPFQPRTHFEEVALQELSESIAQHGIIQPITVRKMGYDQYQLISGERRFRASQIAGLTEVPAYIRIADDQAMLEMALVENIQRSNLDAMEVSISFKRLIDECKITQEELSEKVSKSRSAVANYLRLLKLPNEVQIAIRKRLISMGHAKAILALSTTEDQLEMLEKILSENLSVRDVEQLGKNKKEANTKSKPSQNTSHYFAADALAGKLNTKVNIKATKKGSGAITINFKNEKDFLRISELLGVK